MEKHTNSLVHQHSLYLQQHAHNPVNWVAWSNEAFEQAQQENKLVLISIGYSACHWCHVMEHECFEDEEVAALMNRYFICIKVDREERPDVDQVYMNAVQLMTQRGGWPLNCFTIPNGKPIYGGTYFPKDQWMHILKSLQHTFATDPEKVNEYALELTAGITQSELISAPEPLTEFSKDILPELVRRWQPRMDQQEGGPTHAPKFPLPNNYLFLHHYAQHTNNKAVLKHVKLTLHKMAFGGIYDQLGGGFSRYSVDMLWKVPHFEKMLYDNGQLLSLYATAFSANNEPEYIRVMQGILHWIEREMTSVEGGIFAAQDADSEGEEGRFFVWNKAEIEQILGADANWFWEFYNPHNKGFWEEKNWILIRNETWESFCKSHPQITIVQIETAIELLFSERKRRVAPATDTKCLTAWNALTITGLMEAYCATSDDAFLKMGLQIGRWIVNHQLYNEQQLWHTRQNGESFIAGFLDDYAFTIEAFLSLYQITSDNSWLEIAQNLNAFAKTHFYDEQSGMYFFTASDTNLIARKMEINDNVLPATNSVMAHNLLTLSVLTDDFTAEKQAKQLLQNIISGMENYGSNYSNWALLLLRFQKGISCIRIPKSKKTMRLLQLKSPFVVLKFVEEAYYTICANGSCSLPIETEAEVLGKIAKKRNNKQQILSPTFFGESEL